MKLLFTWVTKSTKVITTADGIQISILEWDGVRFIPGMIHGITTAGTHHGITVDGMILGTMAMVAGMEAGIDGTAHGTTAAGTLHGVMADGMIHGTMVVITDTEVATVMDFMMVTTVA